MFFGWSRRAAEKRKNREAFFAKAPRYVWKRVSYCKNAVNFTPFSVLASVWRMPWRSRIVLVMYSPSPLPPLLRLRDLSTR